MSKCLCYACRTHGMHHHFPKEPTLTSPAAGITVAEKPPKNGSEHVPVDGGDPGEGTIRRLTRKERGPAR